MMSSQPKLAYPIRKVIPFIHVYSSAIDSADCCYVYKSCANAMCIFINTDIHIFIYIYDAASQVPPRNGYGYTGAMFPAPPVGGWGLVVVVSSSE